MDPLVSAGWALAPDLRGPTGFLDSAMPFPDDDDLDAAETVPCPYCRQPIYEEAERCPYCEHYLSGEDAPSRHPWWLVAGVLACLGAALGWVVGC